MTTNTRGGSRPVTRPDDGRTRNPGGARPGSGRPPQSFTLKLDDRFYVASKDAAGNGVSPSQLWTVTNITRTAVTLSSDAGGQWRLVR